MHTSTSLEKIKGVGPRVAAQCAAAGLYTVVDCIHFFPRKYDDYTGVRRIEEIEPGPVVLEAVVERVESRSVRRGVTITLATLSDSTGKVQAVWFNQPYRKAQLKEGETFLFSGEFSFRYNRYQLTNPSVEKKSPQVTAENQLIPVYPALAGLKTSLVRKILKELRPFMRMLPETLPLEVVNSNQLMPYREALEMMHFPRSVADTQKARERFAFEELFSLLLASQLNKQAHAQLEGWPISFSQSVVKRFVDDLPFRLTNAQRLATWEILQDFEKDTPMNRLLQGDVGSGKTVVAGIAARQAAHAGFQTAVMAPTELLAAQHAATLDALLAPFNVRVGLLTGSVTGARRTALFRAIENGEVSVIVGTHALIQSAVTYNRLGFVVIDEQHRFGVAQRQELLKKAERMPHLLAMTATPIPRSLALTVYGELVLSILNEKPANRKPIHTQLWSPNSRSQLYATIDQQIALGRQVYVVCNLIDSSPQSELKSVQVEYARLQKGVFKHRRIGLLHGKLTSKEKDAVMRSFSEGALDILVSTTVIEVGVDVPNATVMLIEDGDRFGLAQLHQLRGRVGRSEHQSYCYIVPSDSKAPSKRLKEIEKSEDGFYLAEVDLELRGPGELYGKAQHGALNLQIATLGDTKLTTRAQRAAEAFVASGENLLHYEELAKQVQTYQRLTTLN